MSLEHREGKRKRLEALSIIRLGMYPIWLGAALSQRECLSFLVFCIVVFNQKSLVSDHAILIIWHLVEKALSSLTEGISLGSNVQSSYTSIAIFLLKYREILQNPTTSLEDRSWLMV